MYVRDLIAALEQMPDDADVEIRVDRRWSLLSEDDVELVTTDGDGNPKPDGKYQSVRIG